MDIILISDYRILFATFQPPGTAFTDGGVLPQRLALLSHQMVVGTDGQLRYLGNVVVHGPGDVNFSEWILYRPDTGMCLS